MIFGMSNLGLKQVQSTLWLPWIISILVFLTVQIHSDEKGA